MKQQLDDLLCRRYPSILVNRDKHRTETCMCWGFECGDGWFNILDRLLHNIQHYTDSKHRQRDQAVKYNEMAQAGKNGDLELFADLVAEHYADKPSITADYLRQRCEYMINNPLRDVPELITQVTLDQVKEKFGTLHFYYSGGDDVVDGMVRMATGMSRVMCEQCGNPAQMEFNTGWASTLCVNHREHN